LEPAINTDLMRQKGVLPLALEEDALHLAVLDPFEQETARSFALLTNRPIRLHIATISELDAAIDRLETLDNVAAPTDRNPQLTDRETQRLRDLASEAPVVRLLDSMIVRAVEANASDIHVEQREHRLRIRMRIDGILYEQESPPNALSPALF